MKKHKWFKKCRNRSYKLVKLIKLKKKNKLFFNIILCTGTSIEPKLDLVCFNV